MTFEQRLCPTMEVRRQFVADCREIFSSPAGARVLARLCLAQHPLGHIDGMTPHAHGNAEVTATLWRYGAATNSLPEPEPKPNNG
jgi:hypothetical protein